MYFGLWVASAAQSLSISTPIDFLHRNSPGAQKYLIETMGGGVAVFDADNDARLDRFFVNGASLADPMLPDSKPAKSHPQTLEPFLSPAAGRHVQRCRGNR